MGRWIRDLAHDATFWLVLIFLSASAISAYLIAEWTIVSLFVRQIWPPPPGLNPSY